MEKIECFFVFYRIQFRSRELGNFLISIKNETFGNIGRETRKLKREKDKFTNTKSSEYLNIEEISVNNETRKNTGNVRDFIRLVCIFLHLIDR